ncbi:hypothetical protein AAF712_008976 [Marasmius tenuissimus]|uniref:Uncharacterized protein n=1 Tax=Marasmius tenuissimus TaxID=585030 RepID=A0ABR2ZR07_9AGAR
MSIWSYLGLGSDPTNKALADQSPPQFLPHPVPSDTQETKQDERPNVREHASNTQETNREVELLAKLEATEKKYRAAKDSHEAEASRAAGLQKRLSSVQKERRQAEDQAKAQVGELQNQLQRSSSQLADLRRGYDELTNESESAQREAERKKREYLSLQSHCESLGAQHENLKKRGQALESERQQLKVQLDNGSGELRQLQEKYKALKLLLEQRTKEHQEAQASQKRNELLEAEYKRLESSFEGQTSEVQQLKEKYDAQQIILDRRTKELQGFEALQKNQLVEVDYKRLESNFDNQTSEVQQLKEKYRVQQLLLDQRTKEIQEFQAYQRRNQLLEAEHKQLKAHFDRQTNDVQQLKEKYGAQQVLLDHRTRELQMVQADLISTRSASGSIVRLVELLNSEIMQVASSITDALPLDQSTPAGTAGKQMVTAKYLGSIFGEETVTAATYHPGEDDLDIIIQNALQCLMVSHCRELIERWHVDPAVSKSLKEMYQRIRKNNPSSVAGRWRTMTKAEMKYWRYDQVENYARTHIVDDIRSLVRRWMERSDRRAQAGMLKMIETKVATVINMATQIDKAMGIDAVSEDWEAFAVHPGKTFDPVLMEDVFQTSQALESVENTAGIVLCSTALGLRRSNESGSDDENREWQYNEESDSAP